jgi:hypothetical protein
MPLIHYACSRKMAAMAAANVATKLFRNTRVPNLAITYACVLQYFNRFTRSAPEQVKLFRWRTV